MLKHKDGVIKKHTLFNIKLDELVEVPTDIELPDWFDAFKKAQFIKLEKVIRIQHKKTKNYVFPLFKKIFFLFF